MYTGRIDYWSFLFYIGLGLISWFLVKKGVSYDYRSKKPEESVKLMSMFNNRYFLGLILIFLFVAVFRTVSVNIGGKDAITYIEIFKGNSPPTFSEPLFTALGSFLRFFSNDYHFYFFVLYLIILIGYIAMIEAYAVPWILFTPFILLIFPYLKSFNTLRSSIAVAVFQIGLSQIRNRKYLSLALIISAFFIHRSSIIFIPIWFFFWVMQKWQDKLKKSKLVIISVALILGSIWLAYFARNAALTYGILNVTDSWYLKSSIGQSLISRWPMYFAHLVLLVAIIILDKRVVKTEKYKDLKLICLYDIALIPSSIILGFWRCNEFNYIGRLIMWGYLLRSLEYKFTKSSRVYYRVIVFAIFLVWLIFRINSEWIDLKIMPYLFDIF